MTALLGNLMPLSGHLNHDRAQPLSSTTTIEQSMTRRQTCPYCSTVLLRHMRLGGLYWRCHHCHAEMPVL